MPCNKWQLVKLHFRFKNRIIRKNLLSGEFSFSKLVPGHLTHSNSASTSMNTDGSTKASEVHSSVSLQDAQLPPPLPNDGEEYLQKMLLVGLSVVLSTFLIIVLLFFMLPSSQEKSADSLGDTAGTESATGDLAQGNGQPKESAGHKSDDATGISDNTQSVENHSKNPEITSDPIAADKENNNSSGPELDEAEQVPASDLPSHEHTTTHAADEPIVARRENRFFTLGNKPDIGEKDAPSKKSSVPDQTNRKGLEGRQTGNKEDLLNAYGGTAVTEGAVKLGLEWLARNQRDDGLWSLQGPYQNPGSLEDVIAASAMALLVFQGAGHTPNGDRADPFTQVVAKGCKGLLKHLNSENEFPTRTSIRGGYTEAICTIALCELYGMTKDHRYRRPAAEALKYCIAAQSSQGGWRYIPNTDSDTSVTGWYLMALQSARMAGFHVDRGVLQKVAGYLDNVASHNGERYGYQAGTAATLSMTAEGLLCRQYLGWPQDDPRLIGGTSYLLENLPNWNDRDVYYWYYATQVTHHMEGTYWDEWNKVMRELLPAKQVKNGAERGSWDPQGDKYGSVAGRLYVTCLSLYQLEVYYRHLPIYQQRAVGRKSRE